MAPTFPAIEHTDPEYYAVNESLRSTQDAILTQPSPVRPYIIIYESRSQSSARTDAPHDPLAFDISDLFTARTGRTATSTPTTATLTLRGTVSERRGRSGVPSYSAADKNALLDAFDAHEPIGSNHSRRTYFSRAVKRRSLSACPLTRACTPTFSIPSMRLSGTHHSRKRLTASVKSSLATVSACCV